MEDFQKWKESLSTHKNVTLKSYKDLNHLFMTGTDKSTPAEYENVGHVSKDVVNDIAAWINNQSNQLIILN